MPSQLPAHPPRLAPRSQKSRREVAREMRAVQMAVDDAYKRAAVEAAAINDAVLRVQLYVECVFDLDVIYQTSMSTLRKKNCKFFCRNSQ